MNDELRDFLNILVVYIVDILIFFTSPERHVHTYQALSEKCELETVTLARKTASVFGMIIQLGRLGSDQEKLHVVEEQSGGLKHRFTSVHISIQPDLSHQFVVEVRASDAGVGAILKS